MFLAFSGYLTTKCATAHYNFGGSAYVQFPTLAQIFPVMTAETTGATTALAAL
jgi:hypothetical protein